VKTIEVKMKLKNKQKIKEARLEIVSKLYCQAWTYERIREEVMSRLNIPSYSLQTVKRDIETLLSLWREREIKDTDSRVQLELKRIDETVGELWTQWERSKTDAFSTKKRRKGSPFKGNEVKMSILESVEEQQKKERLGDVSYIAEIRAQLVERRKLLGLYAPEKRELTGKDGENLFQGVVIQKTYGDDKTVEKTDDSI
jgi:tRNA(Ser,Leu) C12 N-acetylase TAN1